MDNEGMQKKHFYRAVAGVFTTLIVAACYASINDHFSIIVLKSKTSELETKYDEVSSNIRDTKTVVCLIGIRLGADSRTLEDICTNP